MILVTRSQYVWRCPHCFYKRNVKELGEEAPKCPHGCESTGITYSVEPPKETRYVCRGCGATVNAVDGLHGTHLNYDKHELGEWCGPVEPEDRKP